MKKKIITIALVCAMMSGAVITANAATITPQTSDPKNGSTDVSYQVDPTYTITIPESVTLSKDSTVNADITAADVFLEKGKKITVTLTGASNTTTANATTFNAKNNTSVATYTITAGKNSVALGGEVASFTTDGTQALTFSKANTTDVIYAGAHTETLTFTIAVADAVVPPAYADQAVAVTNYNMRFYETGVVSQTQGYLGQPLTFDEALALSEYFEATTGKKAGVIYGGKVDTYNTGWSTVVFVKDGVSTSNYYMDAKIGSPFDPNEYVVYYVPSNS